MPLRFRTQVGVLSFISTTTVFGTPVDVTLQELALETFFPADEATAAALRQLASSSLASHSRGGGNPRAPALNVPRAAGPGNALDPRLER